MSRLFHVSENSQIKIFEPRPPPSADAGVSGDAVWAIEGDRLPHYLLPRDCPRVCLRVGEGTSDEDRKRFFRGAIERVIAIEFDWYERVRSARLFVYELPRASFEMVDQIAGYFISRSAVGPLGMREVASPAEEIVQRGYKLKLLPELWSLRDEAVKSTIEYSIIRMRNAKPRSA